MVSEESQQLLVDQEEGLSLSRLPFRRGSVCPYCGEGVVDYNGMLDLECPVCGYSEGSGGGCT